MPIDPTSYIQPEMGGGGGIPQVPLLQMVIRYYHTDSLPDRLIPVPAPPDRHNLENNAHTGMKMPEAFSY